MRNTLILKKLLTLPLMLCVVFLFNGCSSVKEDNNIPAKSVSTDTSLTENSENTEDKSNNSSKSNIPKVNLNKIGQLEKLKPSTANDFKYAPYKEVTQLLGEGITSYPNPSEENLKIVYWQFEENGERYFLDTTYFENNFVNMESRLLDPSNSLSKFKISNYSAVKEKLQTITSLKDLGKIIGPGLKVKDYYTETKDVIYGWSHDEGFTIAYVSNGDNILYLNTSDNLDTLINDSASCH